MLLLLFHLGVALQQFLGLLLQLLLLLLHLGVALQQFLGLLLQLLLLFFHLGVALQQFLRLLLQLLLLLKLELLRFEAEVGFLDAGTLFAHLALRLFADLADLALSLLAHFA